MKETRKLNRTKRILFRSRCRG